MNVQKFFPTVELHGFKRNCSLLGIGSLMALLANSASASCTYTVDSEWSTGFTASITIKNDTSSPINNWNVNWKYTNNRMSGGWNATIGGTNPYTATNLSWNSNIAVGQSVSFGLQGEKNGGAAERPTVGGTACSGGTTSSTSSSRSSSSTPAVSSSSRSSSSIASALVIEESQAGFCRVDGTIDNNNEGFTGTGFANTNNAQGAAVVWAVESSNSGRQTLTFRYSNGGTANRNGSLIINGGSNGNYTLSLPATGSWSTWQTVAIDVDLVQGNNILQLSSATAEGLPNIDSLSLVGSNVKAGNCGNVSSSSSSKSSSSSSVAATKKFVGNITTSGAVRSDFAKYWNQITPENEGKWGSVESTRGVYNWTALDRIYTYARQNNVQVKAHTFVWGAQAPSWINNLSPAEQATSIENWIRNFCTRYPDTKYIDVVNEAIPGHAPAGYAKSAFGDNWIIKSFQLARKYCPNSVLILNDYNVTSWNTNEFIALAKPLIAAGVVDALGDQAHGLEGFSVADITNNLNKVAALGLPIYITEYDVAKTDDQAQLKIFQQQFPIFYNHPSVKGITLWGYVYGRTWVTGSGLIQDNGTPRPAMTWLMNYLGR